MCTYVHTYMSVWCVGYAAVNAAHLHKVLVDFSTLVTCTFLMPPRPYTHSVCWLQGVDPQERHLSTGPEPALAHVVPQMLPLQQARHGRVCGSVSKLAPLTAEPNGFALSLSVSLLCLWSFTVDHWFSAVHMCTCESLMWYVHTYGGSVVYWCKVGSTACTYLLCTYVRSYVLYLHTYVHTYVLLCIVTIQQKLYMHTYVHTCVNVYVRKFRYCNCRHIFASPFISLEDELLNFN